MYPEGQLPPVPDIQLGVLDHVMEASHRPDILKVWCGRVVANFIPDCSTGCCVFWWKGFSATCCYTHHDQSIESARGNCSLSYHSGIRWIGNEFQKHVTQPNRKNRSCTHFQSIIFIRDNWFITVWRKYSQCQNHDWKNKLMKVEYLTIVDSVSPNRLEIGISFLMWEYLPLSK